MNLTAEQTWTKYEKMVYARCHSFNRTSGVDIEDLIGQAKVKFMKIYEKYSCKPINEFGKLLFISINNDLKDYIRKENGFYELPEEYEEVYNQEYMRYDDLKESLSEDARRIINAIIDNEPTTRTEVVDIARNQLNMPQPTIWRCFREIKHLLRNF